MVEAIQVLRILSSAGLTVLVCCLLGRIALAPFRSLFCPLEEIALGFVLGGAFLSLLVFGLGVIGGVSPGLYLGLASVVVVAWLVLSCRLPRVERPHLVGLSKTWIVWIGLIGLPFSALYLATALAPEASPDGTAYHLGLVARYAREGRILATPLHVLYAGLSQGVEMLFLYAFVLGRHSAATLVHLTFLFALGTLLLTFGARKGMPSVGATACVLFLVSPVVGRDATAAYIDVAVACIVFGCFYLLAIWEEHPQHLLMFYIGILAGFCFGAKYTAIGVIPFAAFILVWQRRHSLFARKTGLLAAALIAGVVIMAGPWLLRSALWYGNPLAPFFNDIFPNDSFHISLEREYRSIMRDFGHLPSKWDIPLELTVRGFALQGFLGPIFLAGPLALLAVRDSLGRRIVLAGILLGATYYANLGTRFLIPCLPFLSLALAMSIRRWNLALLGITALHAILCWPFLAVAYCDEFAWRLEYFPIKAALRIQRQEDFLRAKIPDWSLVEFLNSSTASSDRVFSLSALPQSYIRPEVSVAYYSAAGETLRDALWVTHLQDAMPAKRTALVLPPTKARLFRLKYDGPEVQGDWGIFELSIFGPNGEVSGTDEWNIVAAPNPRDANLALDRNPATRWRTWRAVYSEGHLDVQLHAEMLISSIVILTPEEPWWIRFVSLQYSSDGTVWSPLTYTTESTHAELHIDNLRHAAVRALRTAGMTYLAIPRSDVLADSLDQNTKSWGVTEVHESSNWRIYRL